MVETLIVSGVTKAIIMHFLVYPPLHRACLYVCFTLEMSSATLAQLASIHTSQPCHLWADNTDTSVDRHLIPL